jgi:hypothetical protein
MVKYQLLTSAEIRLLTILPGKDGDEIKCSLETVSLDHNPSYEAISYVWGDPAEKRDIVVDDSIFSVTRNLFAALEQFRYSDRPRALWVDAVCINQEDLDERGSQLVLMGRIYSQCATCQVWLGREDDVPLQPKKLGDLGFQKDPDFIADVTKFRRYIERNKIKQPMPPIDSVDLGRAQVSSLSVPGAFRLLRMMAADTHIYEWPFYNITEFPEFELCEKYYNAYRSLVNILSRPWWGRTWIVQEMTLPRYVVVNIGVHSIELDPFLRAPLGLLRHISGIKPCCSNIVRNLWNLPGRLEDVGLGKYILGSLYSLQHMVVRFRNQPNAFYNGPAEDAHPIITRNRHATDPRDAVYGYLGLLPSLLPAGQQPSYKESVASVYASSTKQNIHIIRTLEILSSINTPSRARTDLPSWAFDWLDNKTRALTNDEHACGSQFKSYTRPDLFEDPALLPIESAFAGTVVQVVNFPGTRWESLDILTIVQTLAAFGKAAVEARQGRHDNLATWRTIYRNSCLLLCNNANDYRKFHSADLAAAKAWVASLETSVQMNIFDYRLNAHGKNFACAYKLTNHVTFYLDNSTTIRTSCCVLDSGRIGACPRGVTPGDRVFVVKGLSEPAVLRAVAEVEMQGLPPPKKRRALMSGIAPGVPQKERPQLHFSGRYSFLGCAYVDGIMGGEAVSEQTEWDLLHLV